MCVSVNLTGLEMTVEHHFAQSKPPSLLATSLILIPLIVISCDSGTGVCTGPNVCTCELGYWGTDCSHQCTCMNGICDDGMPCNYYSL